MCSLVSFFLKQNYALLIYCFTVDKEISNTTILQSKTEAIFKMINFEWSVINDQQLKAYVKKLDKIFDEASDKPIIVPQYSKVQRSLVSKRLMNPI